MRAGIFIDGGYIIKQMNDNAMSPNYDKFADALLAPLRKQSALDLLRCYFYYCAPWMSSEPTADELRRKQNHEKFVEEIEALDRWQFRLGKLEKRFDGEKEVFEQKRVDVMMSVDLVRHAAAGHIQHAVLLAGDSDFIPAVKAAKESGVTITLWCFSNVHKDLMKVCDEVHYVDWRQFPVTSHRRYKKSKSKSKTTKDAKENPTKKKYSMSGQARKSPKQSKKTIVRRKSQSEGAS